MFKKITLLFIMLCATNAYSYRNYVAYNTLVALHKNNTLTKENIDLLINESSQSHDALIAILKEEKEYLQHLVNKEKLAQATNNKYAKIAGYCVGLIASAPTVLTIGNSIMHKALAYNKNLQETYDFTLRNLPQECEILKGTKQSIINYNQDRTSWIFVRNEAFDHTTLQNCLAISFLTLAIAGPVYFTKKLYDYCTTIKYKEKEIERINQIIEQLDMLLNPAE